MAWNSCPRCGRKLKKEGEVVFRCEYCRAPYIIQDAKKYELQDAQRELERLKNKKLTDLPQTSTKKSRSGSDPDRAAAMVKLREAQEMAAWAGMPMPPGGLHGDPVKMFRDYDIKGNKVIDKKSGKTMLDFAQLREHNRKALWGIDMAWLPQVRTRQQGGLA